MRKTWLNEKEKISFYGMRLFRNTNPVESRNAFLKNAVKIHPAYTTFLTILKNLFLDLDDRVRQLDFGLPMKPVKPEYVNLDRQLEAFEKEYEQQVMNKAEELSENYIAEKALIHLKRVSLLMQSSKKMDSIFKQTAGIDFDLSADNSAMNFDVTQAFDVKKDGFEDEIKPDPDFFDSDSENENDFIDAEIDKDTDYAPYNDFDYSNEFPIVRQRSFLSPSNETDFRPPSPFASRKSFSSSKRKADEEEINSKASKAAKESEMDTKTVKKRKT